MPPTTTVVYVLSKEEFGKFTECRLIDVKRQLCRCSLIWRHARRNTHLSSEYSSWGTINWESPGSCNPPSPRSPLSLGIPANCAGCPCSHNGIRLSGTPGVCGLLDRVPRRTERGLQLYTGGLIWTWRLVRSSGFLSSNGNEWCVGGMGPRRSGRGAGLCYLLKFSVPNNLSETRMELQARPNLTRNYSCISKYITDQNVLLYCSWYGSMVQASYHTFELE